jgi:predicted nuclease of predicted toxin-antitoxin system
VRFLIDECLSIDLVTVAVESGHEAQHVAHVGRAGWKDWNVVRYAGDGDFVLVTNNASDFRQLYAAQPLHAGLVILIPAVSRVVQQKLFPRRARRARHHRRAGQSRAGGRSRRRGRDAHALRSPASRIVKNARAMFLNS